MYINDCLRYYVCYISRRTEDISVGEFDAGNVQCYQQIDRPPWVSGKVSVCTRSIVKVRAMVAVVRVPRWKIVRSIRGVIPRADLVRLTIECHVHVQSTIHRRCKHRIHNDSGMTYTAFWLRDGATGGGSGKGALGARHGRLA